MVGSLKSELLIPGTTFGCTAVQTQKAKVTVQLSKIAVVPRPLSSVVNSVDREKYAEIVTPAVIGRAAHHGIQRLAIKLALMSRVDPVLVRKVMVDCPISSQRRIETARSQAGK